MMFLRTAIVKMTSAIVKKTKSGKPFTVLIEGNIGSGKTTFLQHFNKYSDVCVLAEPVEMWRNCANHNLLAYMYEDKLKWSFTFQSYVQFTMMKQHTLETPHSIKLMERSIYSARYCFVENMYQNGTLPGPSYSVLNEWFKWVTEKADITTDLIVYLRTSPEVVYQRMLERNRQEEKTVSLEYLKELHEMHEKWLYHKTIFSCPAPVITLNANLDKHTITQEYEKCEPCILNRVAVQGLA